MNFLKFFPRSILSKLESSNEIHSAMIGAIIKILSITEEDTELLILELCITTSTGMWLNEWGSWFNITRNLNETDDQFRARVLKSIQNPKLTIPALKSNVSSYLSKKYNVDITDDYITIFEPFSKIKSFSNKGEFSRDFRYPDGTYWRGNVIDIYIPKDADDSLRSLVDSIKAAGIKLYYTQTQNDGIIVDDANSLANNDISDSYLEYNCFVSSRVIDNSFSTSSIPLTSRRYSGKQVTFCERTIISDCLYESLYLNPDSPVLIMPDIPFANTETIGENELIEAQPTVQIEIIQD